MIHRVGPSEKLIFQKVFIHKILKNFVGPTLCIIFEKLKFFEKMIAMYHFSNFLENFAKFSKKNGKSQMIHSDFQSQISTYAAIGRF